MRSPLIISVLLHVTFITLVVFGLPSVSRKTIDLGPIIEVEVITETQMAAKTPEPPEEPKEEPKPEKKPPPPPQKPAPPAPPPPPPPPEPDAEVVPDLEQKPEPEPKPEKKQEVAKKPEPKPAPRSRVKPKPPKQKQDFASVLKTVEKLKEETPRPKPQEKKEEENVDLRAAVAEALDPEKPKPRRATFSTAGLSMSEVDALRAQIARCWSIPAGARDAENLIVEIRVEMNPDMTVRRADIVDKARMNRDPFYRTAAESALRAILNPRCSPLRLPPTKFTEWRSMVLSFNPREMFGL